jgi:predicted Co/Zn/Cd cation transporter (cation efflux family)
MSKNTKGKATKEWTMSLGLYPGILIGMRTYQGDTHTQYVFYLPFIDLAIEVEN